MTDHLVLAPRPDAVRSRLGWVRRTLAVIGRAARRHAEFVLFLASLAVGVVRDGVRPVAWRRTVRSEFRRALRQAVGGGLSTTLVTAALIGLIMVSQALYWLGEALALVLALDGRCAALEHQFGGDQAGERGLQLVRLLCAASCTSACVSKSSLAQCWSPCSSARSHRCSSG